MVWLLLSDVCVLRWATQWEELYHLAMIARSRGWAALGAVVSHMQPAGFFPYLAELQVSHGI